MFTARKKDKKKTKKRQNEKTKENHHGNEAEPPSIEKYLHTLMAKKLHGALLVPQKYTCTCSVNIQNNRMIKYISYVIEFETIGNKNMSPSRVTYLSTVSLHTFCPQSFVQRFKIINKKLSLVQNVETQD